MSILYFCILYLSTALLQRRVEEVAKLADIRRKEQERNFRLAYDWILLDTKQNLNVIGMALYRPGIVLRLWVGETCRLMSAVTLTRCHYIKDNHGNINIVKIMLFE